jgi:hypothetical protein
MKKSKLEAAETRRRIVKTAAAEFRRNGIRRALDAGGEAVSRGKIYEVKAIRALPGRRVSRGMVVCATPAGARAATSSTFRKPTPTRMGESISHRTAVRSHVSPLDRTARRMSCVTRVIALMPSIIAELLRHRQCRRHGEAPSGTIH